MLILVLPAMIPKWESNYYHLFLYFLVLELAEVRACWVTSYTLEIRYIVLFGISRTC